MLYLEVVRITLSVSAQSVALCLQPDTLLPRLYANSVTSNTCCNNQCVVLQENAVLYDRVDLNVVVVERSTDGMHELCNDPAVQTSHECPYRLLCAWLLPRRSGWGLTPCEVWL